MLKQLIQAIDSGSTLAEIKISMLDALQMARAAWDSVTAETVITVSAGEVFCYPLRTETPWKSNGLARARGGFWISSRKDVALRSTSTVTAACSVHQC